MLERTKFKLQNAFLALIKILGDESNPDISISNSILR